MDYTVYQLLWLFLFYSFLGWLAETVLAALKRRRLLNRGFLSAPFSPISPMPPIASRTASKICFGSALQRPSPKFP